MKLIVYDDSPDFGGHQVMACRGTRALLDTQHHDIVFFHHPENRRLAEALPDSPRLAVVESPCVSGRFQGLRNRSTTGSIKALAQHFRRHQPERVLCIQGDIEGSSAGVLAAKQAGLDCTSYLALPHRFAQMGARLGSLRDWTDQYLIDAPDRFITISAAMKQRLLERGAQQPISVVPNGIPLHESTYERRPEGPFTVGLLGRIEFNQKQQDRLVRIWIKHAEQFSNGRLLIAGDGPDRPRLEKLIAGRPDITLMPWQTKPDAFYEQIDLLVIPSRYEGVPLVMLEALARGIPVAASRCDGMKDLLPNDWTFDPNNADACAEVMGRLRQPDPETLKSIRERVLNEHNLPRFQERFVQAVTG